MAQPNDPDEVARLIILQHLSRGPRTRAQLAEACAKRGVPEESTRTVLDRYTELGLIDDDAFADAWVQSRHTGRGLSRRALRHELRRRGVPDSSIDPALEQIDDSDEREAAAALVQARLPSLRRYDHQTKVRRLQGLLVRRGYSHGLSAVVVRDVLGEQHEEDLLP